MMIQMAESGLLPDGLVRFGIRRLLGQRLEQEKQRSNRQTFEEALRQGPVAVGQDEANEQHYEVDARFYEQVLGPYLKYSSGYWPNASSTLEDAERTMLAMTCERAELEDGQDVLEMGCGWGSLTLWMAQQYPNSRITAISNSSSQRAFILGRAAERGLSNVDVITADASVYQPQQPYDRVVSVEMFEHMRNHKTLMSRIHDWLKPGGKLVFCEHGAAPDDNVAKWQDRINPVWKVLFGGCNLNRKMPSLIEKGGFRISGLETMYLPSTPRFAGFNYWGVAQA